VLVFFLSFNLQPLDTITVDAHLLHMYCCNTNHAADFNRHSSEIGRNLPCIPLNFNQVARKTRLRLDVEKWGMH
jgi:hypothetical protein